MKQKTFIKIFVAIAVLTAVYLIWFGPNSLRLASQSKTDSKAGAAGSVNSVRETAAPNLNALSPINESEPAAPQPPPSKAKSPSAAKSTAQKTTATQASQTVITSVSPICQDSGTDKWDCYSQYYANLVGNSGVPAAFQDLKLRYNQDSYTQAVCHPIAHVIGRAATLLYPTVAEAYQHGDSFCWSGYYHGVMEGIIAKLGRKNLPNSLDSICADIPGRQSYNFDYYNCVHGLGHGLMSINLEDVPTALALCDRLSGLWEEESCYSGVFMENIIADGRDHTAIYLKPSDPMYPCDWVAEKYRNTCYLGQTSYALDQVGGDFGKVFTMCAAIESQYQDTCYQSLGRDASSRSVYTASVAVKTCQLGSTGDQFNNCIIGLVKDFVSNFHSDVQAKGVCDLLDPKSRDNVCLPTVSSYYSLF